jgi:hypothetical protein
VGRWAFAELTEIHQIDADFKAKVEGAFNEMIERAGRSFRLTPFCMSNGPVRRWRADTYPAGRRRPWMS